MAKQKTNYVCTECGAITSSYYGKCPTCGAWGTLEEQKTIVAAPNKRSITGIVPSNDNVPVDINHITTTSTPRIDTCNQEFNRVLGGGIVPGSVVLLGGEPGIGKSTLILQTALQLKDKTILYCSGEESANQIKMRADRIGKPLSKCMLLSETSVEQIIAHANNLKPDLLIVDSIQTVATTTNDNSSIAGSISQIRECASLLLNFAKTSGIPVMIIGHITKEGSLAGPKQLEHLVDTVLQFEGDRQHLYRILRANKNRFGSTNEIGIFEMNANGLREVSNPSEMLLTQHDEELSGIAVAATIEGIRPLLVEVQALVSTAAYGTPQRSATGFDTHRLNMLLAVLEKRVGFKLAQKDVFLNIAGGIRVNDTALDLAVMMAIISSNLDEAIPASVCLAAEVGLSGELRSCGRLEQRIEEAARLGFKKIVIPAHSSLSKKVQECGIEIITARKFSDVLRKLMQ